MKKIAIIFCLALLSSACGPQRYGCGPRGRCEIETNKNKSEIEKAVSKSKFATAYNQKIKDKKYD